MAGFKQTLFSGIRPKIPESLLPKDSASIALNCDFGYGELRNLKDGYHFATMANVPESIYTDNGLQFYTWEDDVNAVRSPLVSDTFNRLYFTGPDGFRVTSRSGMSTDGGEPASSYLVGVPKPTVAPVLSAETASAEDQETRAYVYTYVNTYNEEGPPSAPAIITTGVTLPASVVVAKDAIGDYAPIKEIRIYRTPTGSSIADYFYSGSVYVLGDAGTTFTFNDDTDAAMLNEALASTNYYSPPQDLVGLMQLQNGILCAWRDNELWVSDAYKPWSWPPSYVKPLLFKIVGGIPYGSGAFITTVQYPYLVSGLSPDALSTTKLNIEQAGVSKWSIAYVDGVVAYASNDGLVVVIGATASLTKSEQFFTRDVWRQRYAAGLSGMRFSVWDGRLIGFTSNSLITPFMIKLDEAEGTMTDLPNLVASCAFISQLTDQFYYANDNNLYQFNAGSALNATWESAEKVPPLPVDFSVAKVVCDGEWSIKFYADDILRYTKDVTGNEEFRLPDGSRSDRWKIQLSGTGKFKEIYVAQSPEELKRM